MSLFGVGLRTTHYPYLENLPQTNCDWFEVISENYMNSRGRPWKMLELIRSRYPVAFHGVSLNIGLDAPVNMTYLKKLKEMVNAFCPFIISDHLCFTGLQNKNLHNLLPLPYTDEVISFVSQKLDQVQSVLGREIAIENLSAYFEYEHSPYKEWEFLNLVSKKSGCKILLDINNIYVNSKNHGFDPLEYLNSIPIEKIAEIHLAGFSDMGDFLFDTHSNPVHENVWGLYSHMIKKAPHVPTLIEWDEDIPAFERLEQEAQKAKKIWCEHHETK